MHDIRYVVIHSPGPAWKTGRPIFEQAGVGEHIDHFRQLLDDGRLEMGGPFLDAAGGGMMIPVAGLTESEIVEFANADPTVASGLLRFQVRASFGAAGAAGRAWDAGRMRQRRRR